jgi:hypothetical protein
MLPIAVEYVDGCDVPLSQNWPDDQVPVRFRLLMRDGRVQHKHFVILYQKRLLFLKYVA